MRVVNHQLQRIDGTERGARSWGMCRQFPAVANQPQDWPRKRAGLMWGGYGRPTFHQCNFRAQPRWQAFVYALEAHSKTPSVCTPMLNSYRIARTKNWVSRTK